MICGPLDKGIRFAFDVGIPEHVVSDTGHANGTRMRDYGGFGDPGSPKNALLIECGQHWEKSAAGRRVADALALPRPRRRGRLGERPRARSKPRSNHRSSFA
jgi:hypothetical protein